MTTRERTPASAGRRLWTTRSIAAPGALLLGVGALATAVAPTFAVFLVVRVVVGLAVGRDPEVADPEIADIRGSLTQERGVRLREFRRPGLRACLTVAVVLGVAQQLTGADTGALRAAAGGRLRRHVRRAHLAAGRPALSAAPARSVVGMDIPTTSRQVHLAQRPTGWPDASTFDLVEVDVPALGDGQVLVVNDYLSVDPYMRGRMDDRPSYVPPFVVGEVMDGGAVGTVVASKADGVPVGASVVHGLGWREVSVVDAAAVRVVDVDAAPASAYLGVLGMTGLTAWVGLTVIARVREGDVVFVSGAAGAVGSVAGQLARIRGASRVVGSAGSADKVAYLTGDLGFDAAFDYKQGPVAEQLAEAAPKGVDVYFDNVGGDHLEAAIGAFRPGGRGALCGAISAYNATEAPAGPRNMSRLVGTRSRLEGFIVSDHDGAMADFLATAVPALDDGSLVMDETVVDGISHAGDAFVSMLRGANTGKMVVRLT